jgi:hypothetical protein
VVSSKENMEQLKSGGAHLLGRHGRGFLQMQVEIIPAFFLLFKAIF